MKRFYPLLPLVCMAAAATFLSGCFLSAAPSVNPTPYTMSPESGVTPTPSPTLTPAPVLETPTATPPPPDPPSPTPTATTTGSSGETTYTVQPGDNLYRIALRFGRRFEDLAAYNHIVDPTRIQPGQVIHIPGGSSSGTPPVQGETLYTVQRGDNLFRLALRYGLNYVYLASYNGITNPNRIGIGQIIRIPPAP